MSYDKPVRTVAIVGTGVIGASWAAQYLARGFDVVATDPGPNAEANLRKYVDEAWKNLTSIGLSAGASRQRLRFTANMKDALSKADLVQENAPERPDFKMKLFADMDDATPADSLIASSSSGITMSVMQSKCRRPERCIVGHPFNPPHIIPLVEVVAGTKTSPDARNESQARGPRARRAAALLRHHAGGKAAAPRRRRDLRRREATLTAGVNGMAMAAKAGVLSNFAHQGGRCILTVYRHAGAIRVSLPASLLSGDVSATPFVRG